MPLGLGHQSGIRWLRLWEERALSPRTPGFDGGGKTERQWAGMGRPPGGESASEQLVGHASCADRGVEREKQSVSLGDIRDDRGMPAVRSGDGNVETGVSAAQRIERPVVDPVVELG